MFKWLKKWRNQRIIKHSLITEMEWQKAFRCLPLLHRLNESEKKKLKRLTVLFLHYKSLESVGELELTVTMRLIIALQACLPILNLGLDWYDGWKSVIIYPGTFSKQSTELDEYGVEHQGKEHLSGESWQRGPVILSWNNSLPDGEHIGSNVVIHEFAHKLDMLNGKANGFPPLHRSMSKTHWAKVFTQAYSDFELRVEEETLIPIDPYAATSPAEFFAVFSEVFFENPFILKQYYPDVYELLVAFYRQDPLVFY